jgi:hypothetical protein
MAKKPNKPKRLKKPLPVYTILHSLNREPHEMDPGEMTQREVHAIGLITVQWAYLEHMLLLHTAKLSNRAKLPLPSDATNFSFRRRLAAWRQTINETIKRRSTKDALLNLASRIASTEDKRHKLTHGLWAFRPDRPRKLVAYSFRPGVAFREEFEVMRLYRLAEQIGQINFALTFPGKQRAKHAHEHGLQPFASRELLLSATAEGREALGPPESTHRVLMPPLSSSPP